MKHDRHIHGIVAMHALLCNRVSRTAIALFMSSTFIVGEFRNQTTGALCTVIKLMPTNFRPGTECYVTDEAEYLEQDSVDPTKFKTSDGDILVATT